MNRNIEIFDSTLRDGAQGQGISFSLEDKLKIVRALAKALTIFNLSSNENDMPCPWAPSLKVESKISIFLFKFKKPPL